MDAPDLDGERLACTRCIGDDRLRADAAVAGFTAECAFCGRTGTCVDIAWLADRIHPALQAAFAPAAAEDATVALDGGAAAASIGGLGHALARDVHDTLVTLFRDANGHPSYPADGAYVERPAPGVPAVHRWEAFAAATATAATNDAAVLDALKWAFAGLDALATPKGRPALRLLEAGTRAFAVLPAAAEAPAWRPGAEDVVATRGAGPLNHDGVPALAVGLRERTAVTQSLAPRGARVAIARLRTTRPLRVVDLEALRKALGRVSAFDADRAAVRARARFHDGLAQALESPPIGSAAAGSWRATQCVGDWLAHGVTPRVDGLLARAAHAPGHTLTLFAPACMTGAVAIERVRRYAVGARRAKYRRIDRDPRP